MKHKHNHDNGRVTDPQLVSVLFELTHSMAITVCVAGTFNQSQPEAKSSMHLLGGGRWLKERYCRPAPLARETVPNPFGGRNSVLKIAISQAQKIYHSKTQQIETTEKHEQTYTNNQ